ncbi:uncharacterized protein V2V93DRAFT_367711 [Kockiozyma suomiensis]|uniref:uncharacterized protein n=1 Tax=Kockiozyma suomiensis TaxID=1337062 RepID=UPI0033436E7F
MGFTAAVAGMDLDSSNFNIAPVDIDEADLPKSLQRQVDARLEKIQREIKAFQEFKQREFESYRNEVVGAYLQQKRQAESATLDNAASVSAGTKRLNRSASTMRSSMKGSSKRQRNGEKKKVMFMLNDEIPPVRPDSDLMLPVEAASDDDTDVQYFQLPSQMSSLSMTNEMAKDAQEELIEDASRANTDTTYASVSFSGSSDKNMFGDTEVASLPSVQSPAVSVANGFPDPAALPYSGGTRRSSVTRQPLQLQPTATPQTPSAEQIHRESTFDYDDVFALDESLGSHTAASFTEPTFKVQLGSRTPSFTDQFHSAFASSESNRKTISTPQSGWVGHSVSLHTPNRSPVTDPFQMDDDIPFQSNATLSVPIPHGANADSNSSSYDDDLGVLPDTDNVSGSAYGSSLPIEIGTPMSSSVRRSSRDLEDIDGGMGMSAGDIGEDEEHKLQKIKSVDNPDRLSFSHRIIWEEHVAGSLKR